MGRERRKKFMNAKKIASMTLVCLFVLSILAIPGIPGVNAATSLSAEDIEFYDAANLTCTNFNVSVVITDVADMKGVGFKLDYNETLINGVYVHESAITSGATSKLPVNGTGQYNPDQPPTINNTIGTIWVGFWGFTPFTGTGTVFTLEFHIEMAPPREEVGAPENKSVSCGLDLRDVEVLDSLGGDIPFTTINGSYTYIRPQKVVGDPTAVCSVTPASVYEGTDVTFDGTASDDGGSPPLTYYWDVDSDGDIDATGAIVAWPNPVAGVFNVTLTVQNNIPQNNTGAPQYWTVLEKLGAIIDLYTSPNRWCGVDTNSSLPGEGVGKGPDMPADALSPDVNVTLFAEVTWNGAPVNHALVAFEVKWVWNITWCEYVPDNATWELVNEVVLMRTAETDKDGIAKIFMRIPTPCDGMMFGKWKAWAKTKVQEVPIEDTMEFDVGYVVTLCTLTILPPYPDFVREVDYLSAEIAFKSISWIPRSGYIAVTVYDVCDVPIGTAWVPFETEPAEYCSPTTGVILVEGIPIPQWAYVGFGKVYASAFTDFPQSCGVAYSPELSVTDIYITWIGA